MPFFHILILIFTNFRDFALTAPKELLVDIAMISHEIRLMPLPYGQLPQELIEMIDNERILPGISYLHKLGEDYPLLNHYNQVKMIDAPKVMNFHQRVLLFDPDSEKI
jgi:hypothetical protein